jgi:site-specific recombinase XerD
MGKKKKEFMPLLEDYFVTYLPFSRGLSKNTINSYKQSFLLLIKFMKDKRGIKADSITFSDLDYETLLEFLDWIEKDRHCKPVTRNQRLSAISAFSEYAQNRDFDAASVFRTSINKIPLKKGETKTRAVFSREEVAILLSLPNERTETGLRDKVMLSLMYATGARAQEVCDLRVRDIQFHDSGATVTLTGKGNKTRRVGVPSGCADMLKKYVKHRKIEALGGCHIFSSQTHEQATISCIEGIYKKYIKMAKSRNPELFPADSYPPHSMRHSTASHLLEAGVDIVTIKNILGHVSLQTTQIYAELSQETVDKKLKEWNETWFGKKASILQNSKPEDEVPEFLRKK